MNWNKVKHEYLANPEITQAILAKKYNVAAGTIAHHSWKERWPDQRKAVQEKVENRMIEKAPDAIADYTLQAMGDFDFMHKIAVESLKNRMEKGMKLEHFDIREYYKLQDAGKRKILKLDKEEQATTGPMVFILQSSDGSKVDIDRIK